jgi:hypothetical protein
MTFKIYNKATSQINNKFHFHILDQAVEKLWLEFFFRRLKLDLQYGIYQKLKND